MKAGDLVRLIGIPEELPPEDELKTRALFDQCLGKTFRVVAMKKVEGLPDPLAQLDVGHIRAKAAAMESIWVEPRFLQIEG